MSKYDALWENIAKRNGETLLLDFAQLEALAGLPLDHSFLRYKKELTAYGWQVEKISMKEQTVRFRRLAPVKKAAVYLHGKGGSAREAEHYRALLPEYDIIGLDYRAQTPWEAREELPAVIDELTGRYASVSLIANSIGAFFAMSALYDRPLERAWFISPIVDMERLISDMLIWSGKSEEELRVAGTIKTDFGETLSWQYLTYVREHPLDWRVPTEILYGERDHLTSRETVADFAQRTGAGLTVMKGGEHWFHTDEQMAFLDRWLLRSR